jgi:hypothetical protein
MHPVIGFSHDLQRHATGSSCDGIVSNATRLELYNVYRVYFKQPSGRSHEGIALVPSELPNQGVGRFYHVKGLVCRGMEYEVRGSYEFGVSHSFQKSIYQFQMPVSYLPAFERVASSRPPPHDPLGVNGKILHPPRRDCAAWVTEVFDELRELLKDDGLHVSHAGANS